MTAAPPVAPGVLPADSPPVRRALARSALYRFFSLACGYPTADRSLLLRGEALPAAHAAALIASRGLAPLLPPLAAALERLEPERLRLEYHAAFGHLPLSDCPAYESAYLGSNSFRQVNTMADVAGFYRAFGLRIGRRERERVDHLTAELEFMSFLARKEAIARVQHGAGPAAVCRRAQRRFWREHLGTWLATFATLLDQRAPGGFYGALAPCLAKFAESERRGLGAATALLEISPEPLSFGEMDCAAGEDACPLVRSQEPQPAASGGSA